MKNKTHMIFDMDGLLIDTESVLLEGWKTAFREHQTDIPEELAFKMMGKSVKHNSDLIYSYVKDRDFVQKIRDTRYNYFLKQLNNNKIETMPYAIELLDWLKSQNYMLSLCTSTHEKKAIQLLEHFKLIDYFDILLFGDSVTKNKPDPEVYIKVLKLSNISADDSLVFEDSPTGATASSKAGIKTNLILNKNLVKSTPKDLKNNTLIDIFYSLKDPYNILRNN